MEWNWLTLETRLTAEFTPSKLLSPGAHVMRFSAAEARQFLLNRPVIPGVVMLRQLYVSLAKRPRITAICALALVVPPGDNSVVNSVVHGGEGQCGAQVSCEL